MAKTPKIVRRGWCSEKQLARYNRGVKRHNNSWDPWIEGNSTPGRLIAVSKLRRGKKNA